MPTASAKASHRKLKSMFATVLRSDFNFLPVTRWTKFTDLGARLFGRKTQGLAFASHRFPRRSLDSIGVPDGI